MRKTVVAGLLLAGLALCALALWSLTPWPRALLLRQAFDKGAAEANDKLARHVRPGLNEILNLAYMPDSPDARLDIYLPPDPSTPPPLIIWVHGGAWVSGSKDLISNYLRLLAAEGYSVAGIDYSLAPGATYPTPVTQTNAALSYLVAHAADYGYDAGRLVLAGDSAGAQIAAQTALTLTDPAYAGRTGLAAGATPDRLKGILLFCGGLDAAHLSLDGPFGGFLSTVLWSYFGHRDVLNDPRLADFSIPQSLHTGFPPLFITVGNADPLAAQSYAVAQRASELGLTTETLFFPEDYVPPLEHEYQFDLDSDAGQEAFRRATLFLDRIFAAPP